LLSLSHRKLANMGVTKVDSAYNGFEAVELAENKRYMCEGGIFLNYRPRHLENGNICKFGGRGGLG